MSTPKIIVFYDGVQCLDLKAIAHYLAQHLKAQIFLQEDLIVHYLLSGIPSDQKPQITQQLAEQLARSRVRRMDQKLNKEEAFFEEVKFETKYLEKPAHKPRGIIYDGEKLQRLYFELIPLAQRNLDYLHIIIVNQLFSTWDEANKRYHLRASIYGFPCLISLPGIVEAPAKPRDFYLGKQLGLDPQALKRAFQDRFINHNDSRLTEVVKGYVMQALFYYLLGDPFCEDRNCRLFYAHWQEELIYLLNQVKAGPEFCWFHTKVLESIK